MSNFNRKRELGMTRLSVHLGALLALLICGVVYSVLIIRPQEVARQELADQTQRLESLRQAALASRSTEMDLRTTLARIEEREAHLRSTIPAAADEHEVLQAVTQAADETGLQIVDYQRTGIVDEQTHSSLRLDVKCRGEYAPMCHFIDRIRNLDRLILVERLRVTSDLASAQHDFTISLMFVYGLKPDASTAGELHDA